MIANSREQLGKLPIADIERCKRIAQASNFKLDYVQTCASCASTN